MFLQVDNTLFQGIQILCTQIRFCYTAIVFQCADRCYQYNRIRGKSGFTALDIKELLRTQIGAETGFRNTIIRHLHGSFGRSDRITSMCNIGKRSAVHQRRGMLQCLDQIRFYSIL